MTGALHNLARVPCIRQELLKFKLTNQNRPFPSCCLSRFRSESWCSTIVREMSLICIRIRNSFPFEWLCTRTRFETEAYSNSEMGYSSLGKNCAIRRQVNCLQLTGPKNHLEDFVNSFVNKLSGAKTGLPVSSDSNLTWCALAVICVFFNYFKTDSVYYFRIKCKKTSKLY